MPHWTVDQRKEIVFWFVFSSRGRLQSTSIIKPIRSYCPPFGIPSCLRPRFACSFLLSEIWFSFYSSYSYYISEISISYFCILYTIQYVRSVLSSTVMIYAFMHFYGSSSQLTTALFINWVCFERQFWLLYAWPPGNYLVFGPKILDPRLFYSILTCFNSLWPHLKYFRSVMASHWNFRLVRSSCVRLWSEHNINLESIILKPTFCVSIIKYLSLSSLNVSSAAEY